jgi:WD40 repeat protein
MRRLLILLGGPWLLLLAAGLWAQSLRLEKTIQPPPPVTVRSTAISPAGNLVAGSCSDSKVRLWSLPSGEIARALGLKDEQPAGLWFSGDGTLLAASGEKGDVRIWDSASGESRLEFVAPAHIDALAISPDRSLVAVAPAGGAVQLRALTTGKLVAELPASFSGSTALAFSLDGSWLAIADSDTDIRIYDNTATLRSTTDLPLETFALTFSADGKYLFAGGAGKNISIIDALTGKVVGTFTKQSSPIADLRMSRDGKLLAALHFDADHASQTGPLLIWDVAGKSVRSTVTRSEAALIGGEFLPDGRFLVTANAKNGLSIWSVR